FGYVDTGAMYRAVGVLAAERGIDPDDAAALGRLVAALDFELARDGERLLVGGRDLSAAIRRPEAGGLASRVSTQPVVRQRLVARRLVRGIWIEDAASFAERERALARGERSGLTARVSRWAVRPGSPDAGAISCAGSNPAKSFCLRS